MGCSTVITTINPIFHFNQIIYISGIEYSISTTFCCYVTTFNADQLEYGSLKIPLKHFSPHGFHQKNSKCDK